ncbi:MAG: glycoside hydrolase [Actinomycetota bacterium]|nr:glycoside hydrolase [Actinomycetota bacterium]
MRRRFSWCCMAVAALGAAVVAQGAASADGVRFTRPDRATGDDKAPTRTYSSPYVLANPDDPRDVFAATLEMRSRTCHVLHSTNAGRTWRRLDASPSPSGYPFCFHTSGGVTQTPMAWGRDRTLYLGMVGWDDQDGGAGRNLSVILSRSNDGGASWQSTIVRNARGKEGPDTENNRPVSSVVVDTKSGSQDIVYVAWRRSYPLAKPPVPAEAMVAVSTDGGRSFGDPVSVSAAYEKTVDDKDGKPQPLGGRFPNPQMALAGDGTLYVLFPGGAPTYAQFNAPVTAPLLLGRSTDQGKTFTVTEVNRPSNFYGGHLIKWSREGGKQGTLHIVFEDKPDQPQGDRDIFHQRSTDGGRTFSEPRVLHDDDPKQLIGQFIPNLDVAPNGRVDVTWWDFRNDPGLYVNDVYYTYSSDNGRTWSQNLRVTDRSINRRIGPWSNNFDMRQPPGLSSTKELAVFAWDDTREGDEVGQGQDIFSAAGQFKALGTGGSNSLRYAIAVLGGLTVVGLVLLVVAALGGPGPTRKREPLVPASPPREPAGIA